MQKCRLPTAALCTARLFQPLPFHQALNLPTSAAQSMSKVKANDKFRFPIELDLSAYLPPEAQDGAVYDLSAILIHKGSSASHGHYGAPDSTHVPTGRHGGESIMVAALDAEWSETEPGSSLPSRL